MSLLLLFGGARLTPSKGFVSTVTVLGPQGVPRPPYGSFAGRVAPQNNVKVFTQVFTVLGPQGVPRSPYGSFNKVAGGAKHIGWMPEWGFRHDPEDLERRLKAQRESAFNPQWLDRFLVAEEKARKRIGKVKTATHRAALEEAVEQVAARVSEAIDEGRAAPEELIVALEAAALATRAAASLKHARRAIEMAQAILMEEEDIEILLLG